MNRDAMLARIAERTEPWDVLIIGGGATGAGIAVDAASRGYSVLLVERDDFGQGTSSRSTKLVHGGVRYLAKGQIRLVTDALRERELLFQNAPHLVSVQNFIIPIYRRRDLPFYWSGMKVYDTLAGRHSFGSSHYLSRSAVLSKLPTVRSDGLLGGILYPDGQFDDARLVINLIQTAAEQGAVVINHAPVTGLTTASDGRIVGATFVDEESSQPWTVSARIVINATGAFCDTIRRMADEQAAPLVAPSQGAHVVLDRTFLPTDHALIVPKTSDGRVLFAIPWHGQTLVGTTDVAIERATPEPRATDAEIDFILTTAGDYLARRPTRADIRSVFAGIRPLVKSSEAQSTAGLSRDHTIQAEHAGLITITGGKWTTYRHMAEDCVNQAERLSGWTPRPCRTKTLPIHGARRDGKAAPHRRHDQTHAYYGTDADAVQALLAERPAWSQPWSERLPYTDGDVVWACRQEMARTVADVLARRTRALILDALGAIEAAPRVAAILADELGRDESWIREQIDSFETIAAAYRPS